MDYSAYIKKLQVPDHLQHEQLIARPLKKEDLKEDMKAVNSSLETTRKRIYYSNDEIPA